MDRITLRLSNGRVKCAKPTGKDIMPRLAAYEDTGLTPEEIVAMKDELDAIHAGQVGGYNIYQLATLLHNASKMDADKDAQIAELKQEIEQYEADIEAGNLVRLPGKLIAPYELNDRYWICGWDSERCTLIIQDRVLLNEASNAELEGKQHG